MYGGKSYTSRYDGYTSDVREISDGRFDSYDVKDLIDEADVIITNPPFSKFREYIDFLVTSGKDFLIMGNFLASSYRDVFPLIKEGVVSLGYNHRSYEFEVPSSFAGKGVDLRIDDEGRVYTKASSIVWYTTLNINETKDFIPLLSSINDTVYEIYENKDAINIDRIKDIPKDFDGIMGVPLTILTKHNPKQFDIVGFRKGDDNKDLRLIDREPFSRVLIKNKLFVESS